MEKIVFADTFTKTFKNVMKIPSVSIDDPVFRLHYRFTGLALLFSSIMVSAYQFFGEPILCIQKDDIPETLLNTFCWIEGTFSLPKALSKKVGEEVVYPGVDTHNIGDEVVEHAYYQWVCFVLFLQAMLFCAPHVIWRTMESGRLKAMIQKLSDPLLSEDEKTPCFENLVSYFENRKSEHHYYALKFFFCEVLNFANVFGQIYFINRFLGGEFLKYGADVVKYINEEQQNRTDPMIRIFPRITKCTFHKYGSAGSVQKHDALCLLPLNILNEKIFVVMWFWFVILAILSGSLLVYRIVSMFSKQFRKWLLRCVGSLIKKDEMDSLPNFSYGNWFLLYFLGNNIDNLHFRNFILQLRTDEPDRQEFVRPQMSNLDDVDKGKKLYVDKERKSLLDNNESSV